VNRSVHVLIIIMNDDLVGEPLIVVQRIVGSKSIGVDSG
jgi:hypothetical protein